MIVIQNIQPTVTQCLRCEWVVILGFPNGECICAVLTAEAVVTGKVSCYDFIGRSERFQRRSARGAVVHNDPGLARMGEHKKTSTDMFD